MNQLEENQRVRKLLGREPNKVEAGIFSVMWSEHCCYKSSKIYLKQFPTTGPRVLQGPGENAGIVDIGGGYAAAFKIESHNHPSFIEPYQGAATGVGGILRDIFTMGARPIANLNSLHFGEPTHPKTEHLLDGVVAGIGGYGNCLAASERVLLQNDGELHDVKIGDYCEKWAPAAKNYWDIVPTNPIKILSYDPILKESCWRPVKRIFKRMSKELMRIKTTLGRELLVTTDHPMVVHVNGQLEFKKACHIIKGDEIPLLREASLPSDGPSTIDLIEIFKDRLKNIYVKIDAPVNLDIPFCDVPKAWQRFEYRSKKRLPLALFLKLEGPLQLDRRKVKLFLPSGKANPVPAIISVDKELARLVGYYLSEGTVSKNGNTFKIVWTFSKREKDYVRDVTDIIDKLGICYTVEKRQSTTAITVSSVFLGLLFGEVWRTGNYSYNKAIPDIFLRQSEGIRLNLLQGLLRGDGSVSIRNKGSRVKVGYASTSDELFHQVLILLQNLGVFPLIYRTKPPSKIQGRLVSTHWLNQMDICNYQNVNIMKKFFPRRIQAKIEKALSKYKFGGTRFSYPRMKNCGPYAVVPVREVEYIQKRCEVYDFEVDDTHLFVTTSGIITHNCMGIPTVGGETHFDSCYNGNILVNAFTLGVMRKDKIFLGIAKGVGNPVILVGSKTGRDGIHGAKMASEVFTEESIEAGGNDSLADSLLPPNTPLARTGIARSSLASKRPTVQVGDPFTEKKLMEACLEAFELDGAIVGIQDMGAAGFTCSSFEMSSKGGVGMELWLNKIPCREEKMTPYEIMLSESQERMLLVAPAGREKELQKIFGKWELEFAVVGKVISDKRVRGLFHGEVAFDLPVAAVVEEAPVYERPFVEIQNPKPKIQNKSQISNPKFSKQSIWRQYDHTVGTNTVIGPGADAAVVRVKENGVLLALTVDSKAKWVLRDPYWGSVHTVAEAARNLTCVGATQIGLTDCLNFGNPENPEIMWQFKESCRGIADACRQFGIPVIGGNVSLYNETAGKNIDPTPVIAMVGMLPEGAMPVTPTWKNNGDLIYGVGAPQNFAEVGPLDFEVEKNSTQFLLKAIAANWIQSAHDITEDETEENIAAPFVVTIRPEVRQDFESLANDCACPIKMLGNVELKHLALKHLNT